MHLENRPRIILYVSCPTVSFVSYYIYIHIYVQLFHVTIPTPSSRIAQFFLRQSQQSKTHIHTYTDRVLEYYSPSYDIVCMVITITEDRCPSFFVRKKKKSRLPQISKQKTHHNKAPVPSPAPLRLTATATATLATHDHVHGR